MRVLVTGAAGRLGRIFVRALHEAGHSVVGIDRREDPESPARIHQIDLLRHAAGEVFQKEKPEAVVHTASVTQRQSDPHDRHRVNLVGTKTLFDLCQSHGVAQAVFVGRHTYYGATSDAALYRTEGEPPLGLESFPELADLVAADLFSGSMLWQRPEMITSVLRFVYTLGPSKTGTLADYLHGPRVPMVLGFDPLFHFMHEQDAAQALLLAITGRLRGVYNVAGPSPLPLSALVREAGRSRLLLPERILWACLGRFGLPSLHESALDHIKYSLVVDAKAFVEATGFTPKYDQLETIRAFASAP
jgi:UDP-glucose 4-epimerase